MHERGVVKPSSGNVLRRPALPLFDDFRNGDRRREGRGAYRQGDRVERSLAIAESDTEQSPLDWKLPVAKLRSELLGADASSGDAQIATVS